MKKGLILAAVHVALALSVTAKFAYDRSTLPRVWVKASPSDNRSLMRGRYLSLRLQGETSQLQQVVAYFVAQDVQVRTREDELWVEVSVPKSGPPRPIRLAVMKAGKLVPLN